MIFSECVILICFEVCSFGMPHDVLLAYGIDFNLLLMLHLCY